MQGRAQAFHINRRQHLDSAWVRQEQAEERMAALGKELEAAQTGSCGQSIEVENLQQLDALIEAAGSVVVVLFMYSKVKLQLKMLLPWAAPDGRTGQHLEN